MSFSAAQLIYTNVEKKLSPTGREGFQVWLRTPDVLSDGEITEIQTRLADFEERRDPTTKDEPSYRHSFFSLSTDRAVIARTVPLAETDQFRRGGRFYAHAYILDPTDFHRLGNDPFAVLDQVQFHATLDDGLKYGNVAGGTIPVAILEERPAERVPPPVAADRLPALIPALLRTFDRDKSILLGACAPPTRILAWVRQLFEWLPPTLRLMCNFDTLSSGRGLTQLPYCVSGLPAAGPPRRYLNLVLYDLAKQAFPLPIKTAADGMFGRWLAKPLAAGVPPERMRAEAAFQLAHALDSGRVVADRLGELEPDLFEELAYAPDAIPKLDAILHARLAADLGDVLAPLVLTQATHWLRSGGLESFRELGHPLPAQLVYTWLLAVYEHRSRSAVQVKTEVPALRDLLDRTKNVEGSAASLRVRMILIFYRWAGKWDQVAKWVADTQLITDGLFAWFVRWALATLPVRVSRGTGFALRGAWCGPLVMAENEADDDECQKLIGSILGHAGDVSPGLPSERWAWVLQELLTRSG